MKNTDSYYFITYVLEAAAILDEGARRGWSGLRSAHSMGLVPLTSPCNKSQGLVTLCEWAIFATKSSCRV